MNTSMDRTIDFRQYLHIPWRRKGILLLSTVAVFCGALVGLSFVPKVYESTATLMMEEHQQLIKPLEDILGRGGSPGTSFEVDKSRLAELVNRVRSRPFLERVANILNMPADPHVRAEAQKRHRNHPELSVDSLAVRLIVKNLQSRISFRTQGPGIYDIIVADYEPETAKQLADWISRLFVSISQTAAMDQLRTAQQWSAEKRKLYEDQVDLAEKALQDYKGSMIQADLTRTKVHEDNLALAEVLYAHVLDDARSTEAQLGRTVSEASASMSATAVREDAGVRNVVDQLGQALARAIDDRLAVGAGESAGNEAGLWPPAGNYVNVRRELAQRLEQRARALYPQAGEKEIGAVTSHAFFQIDAEAKSNAARLLNGQINAYRSHAEAQPAGELELQRLQNDVVRKRELLELFKNQVEASELRQALEATNLGLRIQILNPPDLPLVPSRPNRVKILLAALLLGPLLGAVFAFLAETMDSTLRSLAEIRRLAPEPILGTTPLLAKLRPRTHGWRRHWVPAAVTGVVLLTLVFFIARMTVLQDRIVVGRSIQATQPGATEPQAARRP